MKILPCSPTQPIFLAAVTLLARYTSRLPCSPRLPAPTSADHTATTPPSRTPCPWCRLHPGLGLILHQGPRLFLRATSPTPAPPAWCRRQSHSPRLLRLLSVIGIYCGFGLFSINKSVTDHGCRSQFFPALLRRQPHCLPPLPSVPLPPIIISSPPCLPPLDSKEL